MNQCHASRRTRFTLRALLVLLAVCAFCRELQAQQSAPVQRPADPNELQVIPLKYATASEVAHLLQETFGSRGREARLRIGIDDRNNSLIISGSAMDLEKVQQIIRKIDVSSTRSDAGREIYVFDLKKA